MLIFTQGYCFKKRDLKGPFYVLETDVESHVAICQA